MKIESFDSLLRQALLLAAIEDAKEIKEVGQGNPPWEVSSAYAKNRILLLTDPFRYAKRKLRPTWKKALRAVACLFLVCSLAFSALMLASPSARAVVKQWFVEWYEKYVVYRFVGETESEGMPQYRIGALPEGYLETNINEAPGYVRIKYETEDGGRILFSYMHLEQGGASATEMDHMQEYDINVNGCSGKFFLSQDSEESSAVVWIDETQKLYFSINMFGGMQEILHIAESVYLIE